MKNASVRAIRHQPDALPRDAARGELIAHDRRCGAVKVGERVFLILACEVVRIVRAHVGELQPHTRVFRLHDAHPLPHWSGRVVEDRADAESARCAKRLEALAGESVDEIARLQMRARPAVEAAILPKEKPPRTRAQHFRRILQQAIDDVRSQAVGADGKRARIIAELPRRVAGVVAAERAGAGQFHGERKDVAGVCRGEGDLHATFPPKIAVHSAASRMGVRTSRIHAR
jgi:hypothetical protein